MIIDGDKLFFDHNSFVPQTDIEGECCSVASR